MIRKTTINEILTSKIAPRFDAVLTPLGFKFLKAKDQFYRHEKDYDQKITLSLAYDPVKFDEASERLYLDFSLIVSVDHPGYNQWYPENTNEPDFRTLYNNQVHIRAELELDDFKKEDFYAPRLSQPEKIKYEPLESFLKTGLPKFIATISEHTIPEKLFESRKFPLSHTYFLLYMGRTELANKQLDLTNEYFINEIKKAQESQPDDVKNRLEHYDEFLREAAKLVYKKS